MDTVRPNTTTTALVPVMQDVWLARTPFSQDLERASVPIGQTLRQVVGPVPVQAWVDGVVVTDAYIDTEVLPRDAHIIVAPMPQGADTWKTIGAIALVVAALALPAVIPWVVGAVGLTGVGAALVTGGLYALAAWGLYEGAMALFPPPTLEPQESFNTLASLTGQRNRMGAFRAIPRLYGRMRYYPPVPMTAPPYTELSGDNQYQRIMLCLGYGPLSIGGVEVGPGRPLIKYNMGGGNTALTGTPIRIGNTAITEYEEVSFQIGRPDQITLYTNEVLEKVPNWNTSHPDPATGWNTDGESFIQTSDPDAVELSIDIWAALFSVNDEGKTKEARIEFKLEYRPHGGSTWTVQKETITLTSSKRETIRLSYNWTVPLGQYDVRLTRKRTYHANNDATANDASWVALRTIRNTPAFTVPDTIIMALRIRSSDQLQGTLDNVSVEATSVLPVWNGTTWVEQATRAPAWAYADMLTGTATRRPLKRNRLDAPAIKAWADDTNGVGDYFDHVFDDTATLFDRIRAVTAAGRVSWALRDDAIMTVVRDVPDATPRMLISPRNSSGFRYEMAQADIPQALRVQFIDAGTWENTERIVYDDGYDESNTTLYQTIEALGVTSPEQAWRLGRYHLAQLRLRPETYSFMQDVQHLHYRKGDLLHLQQDVIAVGIAAGRIAAHTYNPVNDTTTINVDVYLTMEPGKSYGLRYQGPDGAIHVLTVNNAAPGTRAPVTPGKVAPAPDSHFVYGEASLEVIAVKVLSIEPQGEYMATVTCVPAALDILDALSGTIPPFDPMMTIPADPSRLPLPVPTITRIASGDAALIRDTDGSPRQRMLVELTAASVPGWGGLNYQLRYRVAPPIGEDTPWTMTAPVPEQAVSIYEVEAGLTYELQARTTRTLTGAVSDWSLLATHLAVGVVEPPPQVTGLVAMAAVDQVQLTWDPSEAPDIADYEVRLATASPPAWATATPLARSRTTSFATGRTDAGPYLVRARNAARVLSAGDAVASITVTLPAVTNLQAAVTHNIVTLAWGVTAGTWPVSHYELWRGLIKVGTTPSTYITITEQTGGEYTYRIVPVTTTGDSGTAATTVLQVGDPSHAGGEQQFEFAKGTDVDTPPATGWQATPPATQAGEYIWLRTRYVSASGTPGDWSTPTRMTGLQGTQGPQGLQGLQGPQGNQGIQGPIGPNGLTAYSHIAYADDAAGGGFSQSPTGKAYIGFYADHTEQDSSNPGDYRWSLIKGADGANGIQGPIGPNGIPSYFHTAWANNDTGTSGFSTTVSAGKLYIGTYADHTAADSTDPTKYKWVKIKGETGDTGAKGDTGATGAAGLSGVNTAVVYLYRRGASAPTKPSTTATYTFATGALTGHNNGWAQAVPATDGNPLWVIQATVSAVAPTATATIAPASWGTAIKMVEDGAKGDTGAQGPQGNQGPAGLNQATIYLYQRKASVPAVTDIADPITYTFATGAISGSLGSWSRSVPAGTNPLYVTTAVAIGSGATDAVPRAEWTTPVKMAEDGAKGDTGATGATGASGVNTAVVYLYRRSSSTPTKPSTTSTYTFATGVLTGHNNSWTQAVPATDGNPLWVIQATVSAIATSPTATIASSAWGTAIKMVEDGAKGEQGPQGLIGPQGGVGPVGQGIDSITEQYAISTSKTTPPAEGSTDWKNVAPTWSTGKYLWTRSKIVYKNPTDTKYTTPVCDNAWEAVNEIVIGGRNLAHDTNTEEWKAWSTGTVSFWKDGDRQVIRIEKSSPGTFTLCIVQKKGGIKLKQNTLYTLSFEVRGNYSPLSYNYLINSPGPNQSISSVNVPSEEEFTKVSIKVTPIQVTYEANYSNIMIGSGAVEVLEGETKWFEVKNVKIELGNIATDWTPAPEDLEGVVDLSVKSSDVEYYLSTSATSLSGGSWQTTAPTWVDGKYMWSRTRVELNNGTVRYTPSESGTCIAGAKGDTGATGSTGAQGATGVAGLNQATLYLYQRKASAPAVTDIADPITYTFATGAISGSLGAWLRSVPSGTNPLYVTTAVAIGNTATDTIPRAEWTAPVKMAEDGAKGDTGETGAKGDTGAAGASGINTAVVYLYRRGASAPTKPSTVSTYTFATGILTGHNNGWTQAVPVTDGNPLWVIQATASATAPTATASIPAASWGTQIKMVVDGAKGDTGATGDTGAKGDTGDTGPAGLNQATLYLYQRKASKPALTDIAANLTYTFATGTLTGDLGAWSRTVPSGTAPLYVTVAAAISNTATDTIPRAEWTDPVVMVKDGEDGADGADGADGTPARVILLTKNPSVISRTMRGVYNTLEVFIHAEVQNIAGNPVWGASVGTLTPYESAPGVADPFTVVLDATTVPAGTTVTATIGAYSAEVFIDVVAAGDGEPHNFKAVDYIPEWIGEERKGLLAGDHLLWSGETLTVGGTSYIKGHMYVYDGSHWVESDDRDLAMAMIGSFTQLSNDVDDTVIGNAVIKDLVALRVFIQSLMAQDLEITNSGQIRQNYDELGRLIDDTMPGFYLGNGLLKAYFAELLGTLRTGPNAPTNARVAIQDEYGLTSGPTFTGTGLNDMSIMKAGGVAGNFRVKISGINNATDSGKEGYWTTPFQVGTHDWYAVAVNSSGRFVAVGYNGYISYSDDGITWATPFQVGIHFRYAVAVNSSGRFVAVGEYGDISYSDDGITWATPFQVGTRNWESVAVNSAGRFVAVGDHGYVSYSNDGITWATPFLVGNNHWFKTAVNSAGKFVAVGNNGYISYSNDGITWATPFQVGTRYWSGIAVNSAGRFVAVGGNGYISYSNDGITWVTPFQVVTYAWSGIAVSSSGRFVAVGTSGYVSYSNDGITWATPFQVGPYAWSGIAVSSDGRFVAVGQSGYIAMSLLQDTIQISSNGGTTWGSAIPIPLDEAISITGFGIDISFSNFRGHTVGDYWSFTQGAMRGLAITDSAGHEYFSASNGAVNIANLHVDGENIVKHYKGTSWNTSPDLVVNLINTFLGGNRYVGGTIMVLGGENAINFTIAEYHFAAGSTYEGTPMVHLKQISRTQYGNAYGSMFLALPNYMSSPQTVDQFCQADNAGDLRIYSGGTYGSYSVVISTTVNKCG